MLTQIKSNRGELKKDQGNKQYAFIDYFKKSTNIDPTDSCAQLLYVKTGR